MREDRRPRRLLPALRARWVGRTACGAVLAVALLAPTAPVRAGTAGGPGATVDVVVASRHGSEEAAKDFVIRHGGVVTGRLPLVHGFTASVPASQLGALSAAPAVAQVSVDRRVEPQQSLGDTAAVRSVYRDTTGAVELHDAGLSGRGVTVALIDTGVADVDDLAGRVLPVTDPVTGRASSCVDFSGEGHCGDSYGHGTFMAGIIAGDGTASGGRFAGMAPGADLVSLKVAGEDGSSDVSKVVAAIQWAVAHRERYGIRVINLSLGTDSTQSWQIDPFNYAVQRAWDAGIVVAVAASNMGPAQGTIGKPGDDPWVLTVGAVDDRGTSPTGDDRQPDFSSRGPTAAGVVKPDVVAPGAHIVSLRAPGSAVEEEFPNGVDATYRRGSGTSMATAAVSGGVALLLEQHPGWTPEQVKHAVRSTAQPTATTDVLAVGAGSVDFAAAGSAGGAERPPLLGHSNGLGPLDPSRGSVEVRTDSLLGTLLSSTLTAQLLVWDPVGFTTGSWDAETWRTSPFLLNRWYRTRWYGNNWQGNNWQEDGWLGNNWHGNNWQGDWQGGTADDEPPSDDRYGKPWLGAAWYGLWE